MPASDLRIIIDDGIPFLEGVLENVAKVTFLPSRKIDRRAVMTADALVVRTTVVCDAGLLDGTAVKFIASATIGLDHIDTAYCAREGIAWSNAPGCNANAVYQYLLSAVLRLMGSTGRTPAGMVMGIVGAGHVGSKTERMAHALGMEALVNDPPRARAEGETRFVSLDKILESSDIVTLHVPLTQEGPDPTFRMADRSFFERIKKPVWFINTSRGPVVDETALMEAIDKGIVAASVIDVWNKEPVINHKLLKRVTYGTPHIAGYSAEGKANGSASCVRALSKFFGLGLDDWYPANLPEPAGNCFGIDTEGKTELAILLEAVTKTYDIRVDDAMLRNAPEDFPELRNHYPMRREPSYYSIRSGNILPRVHHKLNRLGFEII